MSGIVTGVNRLKVLSLLDDVTGLGGVEAFQYDLAAGMPAKGIAFRALNLRPKPNANRQLPAWATDYPSSRWLRGRLIKFFGQRFMRQFWPCFFLAQQPSSLSFLMTILPERRWPVLSIVHNNSTRQSYWQSQIRWQQNILGYVAVSAAIRNRLIDEFGLDRERVWTIPCGVNHASPAPGKRLQPPGEGKHLVLLYAGRLANYAKQVLDLVGVAQALNHAGLPDDWKIALHIAGDGPEAEELKRELYHNAGRIRLHWHGRIPRERLFQLYEQSHLILLLSSFEGMPMALREAMSRGTVPVVTDIVAHREIITPGKNGFLFPLGDVVKCASLCRSLALSDRFEQVSRNAALWTQDQSVEATTAKYAELLEGLSLSAFPAGARAWKPKLQATGMLQV